MHCYSPFFCFKWIENNGILHILARFLMCLYCCALDFFKVSWDDGASRLYLDNLVPESPVLPVFKDPVELLEFTVNNIDYMDIVHPSTDDLFCIETTFLDTYRQRTPGTMTYGATIVLKLGPCGTFSIISIQYRGATYDREDIPRDIACGVLWGILTYVTVGTNLYYLQHRAGAAQTQLAQKILPITHTLRQILVPATDSLAPTLLARSGMPAHCFPYTYDNGGLDRLLKEYVPWDPLDPGVHLMEFDLPVIGDYRRWWIYILGHMNHIVTALYPSADDLKQDIVASRWIKESTQTHGFLAPGTNDLARLPVLLSLAYLGQVRQNFLSNDTVDHIIRWYYILAPGPTSVSQASRMMLTMGDMRVHRVQMTRSEVLIDNIRVRQVMDNFYNGLGITGTLANSIRHPMAHPAMCTFPQVPTLPSIVV